MLGQAGGGKKITLDDPELQMVASGSTERRTKSGQHSHCCCEARPPRRPSTATSKPVAPIASFARREWVELAPGAEAPAGRCRGTCRTARPCPRSQPATTTYRADPRTKWPEKGRGKNPAAAPSARRSHEPNPAAAAQPQLRRVFLGPAGPNGGVRRHETTSRCGNAQASPPYSELGRARGIRHLRDRGVRGFTETASATTLEAAFGHERDDASRLAQRCYLRPHSTVLLLNSLLRPRPSLMRSLTSLQFCCVSWALTRGRELSGERPRTLI